MTVTIGDRSIVDACWRTQTFLVPIISEQHNGNSVVVNQRKSEGGKKKICHWADSRCPSYCRTCVAELVYNDGHQCAGVLWQDEPQTPMRQVGREL
jgi:predicted amidophosphoribosyltransferase